MSELNLVEKVIALEAVELFKTLTPDQLARIASIATEVSFAQDKSVIEPGRPMDGAVRGPRRRRRLEPERR